MHLSGQEEKEHHFTNPNKHHYFTYAFSSTNCAITSLIYQENKKVPNLSRQFESKVMRVFFF